MQEYKFNVFGKPVAITGSTGAWKAFYLGSDGKRRLADFLVPQELVSDELCEYLADLFHENATPRNGSVVPISPTAS